MEYNFNRSFGGTFTVETFSKTMKFIHAFNEAKERAGSGASEERILAELRGYNLAEARAYLVAIRTQFGSVPAKDQETKFMQDYYAYMRNAYDKQREKVQNARKDYNEEKKFRSPNGVEYSASQLKTAGKKAKKDARKSRVAKYAIVAAAALLGAWLVPMVITSVFTGVMAVSTLSTLTAIGGLAGLVGGGLIGRNVYNMGGRKEKLENNDALAKFMAENIDALNIQEADLQSQEEALKQLKNEFGLELNAATREMESEEFNEIYNEYASAPLSMTDEAEMDGDAEVEVHDMAEEEAEAEAEAETETEAEAEAETETETEAETETEDETEAEAEAEAEAETEAEAEAEAETEAEAEAETETEDETEAEAETEAEEVETGSETESEGEVEVEEEPVVIEEPETEPVGEEEIKKQIRAARSKYSRAINSGVCSPVGQYMLVALREQVEENVRDCSTPEEMQEVLEIASEEVKQIVSDYKKYTSKDGKHNAICLHELPESEQGIHAGETKLPAEFSAHVDDKTYVDAVKRGYAKTNEKLVEGYIQSIGADAETSSDIRESAKLEMINSLAEANNFEGLGNAISDTEAKMKQVKDELARKVNGTKKEQVEEEEESSL